MNSTNRNALVWASVFISTAIVLGAFGAHALKAMLTEAKLTSFNTAVRYQMWMAIGLFLQGLLAINLKEINIKWSARLLIVGVIMFSGSIYGLTFLPEGNTFRQVIGPITPLGGILMIVSWAIFTLQLVRSKSV